MKPGEFRHRPKPGLQQGIGLLLIGVVMAGWGFWHLADFIQTNDITLHSTTYVPFGNRVLLHALFAVLGVVALLRGVRALLAR